MGGISEGIPVHGRDGWPLLHRLRRLLWTPTAPRAVMPGLRTPADALPAGLCVLVADDNPLNLMLASEMLAYFGVKSVQAADGVEAVAIAADVRLDLILMDLQMPVLDGLGATLHIRKSEREQSRARIPVLAYTSINCSGLPLTDCGVDGVLEKPCEIGSMRECLLRWCPLPGTMLARAAVGAPLGH